MISDPGSVSSIWIIILITIPRHPAHTPRMRQRVPIFLSLNKNNQHMGLVLFST